MPVVDNVVNHMKATVVPLYQVYSRPLPYTYFFIGLPLTWFISNLFDFYGQSTFSKKSTLNGLFRAWLILNGILALWSVEFCSLQDLLVCYMYHIC